MTDLLHNDVRWLSKGKALECVSALLDEVKMFLSGKRAGFDWPLGWFCPQTWRPANVIGDDDISLLAVFHWVMQRCLIY